LKVLKSWCKLWLSTIIEDKVVQSDNKLNKLNKLNKWYAVSYFEDNSNDFIKNMQKLIQISNEILLFK
jgi:hypothetical protein